MTSPMGRAKIAATSVTRRVPATSGQMPKLLVSPSIGLHCVVKRNSEMETSAKNRPVSKARIPMISAVMIRVKLVQSTSAVLTRISDRSLHSRRRGLPRRVSWSRDVGIPGSSELMLM